MLRTHRPKQDIQHSTRQLARPSTVDISRRALLSSACAAVLSLVACHNSSPSASSPSNWIATWGTSQQITEPGNLPPAPGLSGNTLRQRVKVSTGGATVRLRFANTFGNAPLVIGAAALSTTPGGSIARVATARTLKFRGADSVTIPVGAMITSDAFDFDVQPLSELAISLYIASMPSVVTGHPGSRNTSYITPGNHVLDEDFTTPAQTDHWYVIADLEVVAEKSAATVVTLGNSITDGRGSGVNKNNRWPDNLAARLQANADTKHVSVVNAGIGGNTVLRGGLGPTALLRFERDVLDRPNVKWVLLLEGVNDLGGASAPDADSVADGLIAAYKTMVAKAHARGIKMYGCTILPFGKAGYDTPPREAARQKVNAFVRQPGAFDAVVDFDLVMRDPANPTQLISSGETGDHLHPNEAGYVRMANAIDLKLFKR
ncbi:MAG: SGNH/GDSL hydrolase family protein [Gemmatimonas sp.]